MGLSLNTREVEEAPIWLLNKLASENYDYLIKMAMTLWSIWFFRNKKVWENKVVTLRFVVDCSMNQLHDWKSAVSKVQNN